MAYSASNIIRINTRITPQGLAAANFGSAMLIVPSTDTTSVEEDTYKTYGNVQEVAADFAESTEAYKAASVWLGGTPTVTNLMIWRRKAQDSSWSETLNKIRNAVWWYWTIVTSAAYEQADDVLEIAQWCETNESMFINCQTGESAQNIRDQLKSDDIASKEQ